MAESSGITSGGLRLEQGDCLSRIEKAVQSLKTERSVRSCGGGLPQGRDGLSAASEQVIFLAVVCSMRGCTVATNEA